MKVGLVPLLYQEYNYGGVLQFYALQHVLQKYNIECNIIDFDNDERVCYTEQNKKKISFLKLKIVISRLLNKKNNKYLDLIMEKRRKRIDIFRKTYYVPIVHAKDIRFSDYDAIICGSDQIWNPSWARRRLFLEFVPEEINKVIYGASLGVEKMTPSQMEMFKPRIERLQHVSVREYSAKHLLECFIENTEIKVVLDPTLLLSSEEWQKMAENTLHDRYILTYFLGEYADKTEYIKKIAAKLGLKIINIPFASGEKIDKVMFGDIKIIDADPGEFIGLIKGADYVLTDSFHACVFSILFKVNFYVFKRDGKDSMMGRIDTLLHHFHLPDRVIDTKFDIQKMSVIDYSNTDILQEELRKESLDFLLKSIQT